jgi:hypothetical protein
MWSRIIFFKKETPPPAYRLNEGTKTGPAPIGRVDSVDEDACDRNNRKDVPTTGVLAKGCWEKVGKEVL